MAKKASRREAKMDELNITSMMDMMTIILVFLLKSFSTEDISVQGAQIELPISTSVVAPKLAVNVVIAQDQLLVDGEPVLKIEEGTDASGRPTFQIPEASKRGAKILDLFEKLEAKAETAKRIGERAGSAEFDFKGQVLLQVDKEIPFSVVRDVMYTAGQAQFGEFRFVVIKGSG